MESTTNKDSVIEVECDNDHDSYSFHTGQPFDTTLPQLSLLGGNEDQYARRKAYIDMKSQHSFVIPRLSHRPIDMLVPLNGTRHMLKGGNNRQYPPISTEPISLIPSIAPSIAPSIDTSRDHNKRTILRDLTQEEESDTLWDTVRHQPDQSIKNTSLSWDTNTSTHNLTSPYLTELGSSGFEALYSWQFKDVYSNDAQHISTIDTSILTECLFSLLQGVDSKLFAWDKKLRIFKSNARNLRIIGCGSTGLWGSLDQMLRFGTALCRLDCVVETCRDNLGVYGMTCMAFVTALDEYLSFVKETISEHIKKRLDQDGRSSFDQSTTPPTHLVFIEHAIKPTYNILERLCRLCGYSSEADPQFTFLRGSALLSHIYTAILDEDFTRTPIYFELLLVLMDAACRPLFEWLGCWLGAQTGEMVDAFRWIGDPWQPHDPYHEFFLVNTNQNEHHSVDTAQGSLLLPKQQRSFVSTGDTFWQKGYQLSDNVEAPNFLSKSLVDNLLATGKCLRLLRDCRPDHSVFNIMEESSVALTDRWSFLPYVDIGKVFTSKNPAPSVFPSASTMGFDQFEAFLSGSSTSLHQPHKASNNPVITIANRISYWMSNSKMDLDLSRQQLQSTPVSIVIETTLCKQLRHRCRVIDLAVLRLFLCDLKLVDHLDLLYRFVLLHDGFYVQTLATALFDDTNKSGIRLNTRPSWPPKVYELSTALRAVLLTSVVSKSNVPDGIDDWLSFGIKEYESAADICCDPNGKYCGIGFSLYCLSSPTPLNIILTDSCMEKYNRLFCHLLRLNRMSMLMADIYRLCHNATTISNDVEVQLAPLRFQMLHFIEALRAYTFECALAEPWLRLTRTLEQVVKILDASSSSNLHTPLHRNSNDNTTSEEDEQRREMDRALQGITNLAELREFHEHTLDRMLDRCLLRQEHAILHKIIEAIFGLVIRLGRILRNGRGISVRTAKELGQRLSSYIKKLLQGLVALERERGVRVSRRMRTAAIHTTSWRAELHQQEEREGLSYLNSLVTRIDLNGYYATVNLH
ncbi:Spc98 family-domain-containing protein [Syncephalis fuscata]|nr:Spc98 family-domain-containing protein [Syncephalis fuscata]